MCTKNALTKDAAIRRLQWIKGKHNKRKSDRKPCRFYYCPECNYWHLTSMPLNDFFKNKKI